MKMDATSQQSPSNSTDDIPNDPGYVHFILHSDVDFFPLYIL